MLNNFAWNRSNVGRAQIKPVTLAFGDGATTIAYSYDGIYWNPCGNGVFTTRANHGCWNGSVWVAVGTGGNWVATSFDGISWVGQEHTIFTEGYYVSWNGVVFLAAGIGGDGAGNNSFAVSYDGFNWTAVSNTSSIFSICANYVEWTGNVWCAVGSGTNTTATTTDPTAMTNWTATNSNYMVTDASSIIWDISNTTVTASSGNAGGAFDGQTVSNTTIFTEWRTSTPSYNSDGTATSLYTTNVAGQTICGEYLTIAVPQSTTLNYYVLQFSISGNLYEIPKSWYLLGANTYPPASWNIIDTFSFTKNTPPIYGSTGYYSVPIPLPKNTAAPYQYYQIVFTNTFASVDGSSYLRVMEVDLFFSSSDIIDRKLRPFVTPNGVIYPIRLGNYNYILYADRNNSIVKTNTFGINYYNCDISGLNLYSKSGFTDGFAYDGQNCLAISSVGKMSYTPDFGKTWSSINPSVANTELYAVAFNGTYFIMGGNQYISVFTNGNSISYVSPSVATSLFVSAVDISSIYLTWSADDDLSVQILYNKFGGTYSVDTDPSLNFGNTILSTSVNGLLPNTRYYFKITPISYYGEFGTPIADVNTVTYSYLPTFNLVYFFDTSALVSFDGSFAYMDLSYGSGITYRYYNQTSTTNNDISNITPNSTYNVTSIVYNLNGVTSPGKSVSFFTYPKVILSSTTVDISSVVITVVNPNTQFLFSNISWNLTGSFSESDPSNSYYTDSLYLSSIPVNTTYYFKVIPYGSTGLVGRTVYINATTPPTQTKYSLLIYDTSAQISFDGSMSYIDISYSVLSNNTVLRYYSMPGTTKLDISNLIPDMSYNFYSAIYNRGNSQYLGQSIFAYTLPKVSQIIATSVLSSDDMASITLSYTGNYTLFNIWWNLSGENYYITDSSAVGITGNTYIISGLPRNTIYYIRTLPIGQTGIYGYVRDISINTTFEISGVVFVETMYGSAAGSYPMILNTFSATANDISSINLNWSGLYDNVIIQYDISSGFVSPTTYNYFNVPDAVIYGLSYNTTYYFRATPSKLASGITGNVVLTNATTDSILTNFTLFLYDTSATILYDGSFSYIDISYSMSDGGGDTSTQDVPTKRYMATPPSSTLNDISNLIPDTSYVFQSIIYGRIGKSFNGQQIVDYTLPKVTEISAIETSFTSAQLYWNGGKYTAMNLYWNTTGSSPNNTDASASYVIGNTYIVSELPTNTIYYFWAQPVGITGYLGYSINTSLNLYNVYFNTLTAVPYDASTIMVSWTGYNDTFQFTYDISSEFNVSPTTQTYNNTTIIIYSGGFAANTIYYFKATPFTTGGIQGNAIVTYGATTATLTTYITYIYDTSAEILYDGSLSYVDISYVYGATGAQVGTTARYTSSTPSYAAMENLIPDTSYVLQLSYYNVIDYPLTAPQNTFYTLPKISTVNVTETSFTSAEVKWDGGKYSAMNLYWNTTGTGPSVLDSSSAAVSGNTYVISDLPTNTIYYFWAQPVGFLGATGTILEVSMNLYSVWLNELTATAIDISSIFVYWSGSYDTVNYFIDISTNFIMPAESSYDSYTNSVLNSNLAANTTYYFKATSFTFGGLQGNTLVAAATTGASLTTYTTIIYDVSAAILYDGSLSYVDISYVYGATGEQIGTTTRYTNTTPNYVNIENLVPDTSYILQLSYYNRVGDVWSTPALTIYTLPVLSTFTSNYYDSSSVLLSWSGTYTKIILYWNTTGAAAMGPTDLSAIIIGNTYILPDISANTSYFWAQAVGITGSLGNILSSIAYNVRIDIVTLTEYM